MFPPTILMSLFLAVVSARMMTSMVAWETFTEPPMRAWMFWASVWMMVRCTSRPSAFQKPLFSATYSGQLKAVRAVAPNSSLVRLPGLAAAEAAGLAEAEPAGLAAALVEAAGDEAGLLAGADAGEEAGAALEPQAASEMARSAAIGRS